MSAARFLSRFYGKQYYWKTESRRGRCCEPPSENLSKEEERHVKNGKMPVVIPAGVTVDVKDGNVVAVKGGNGESSQGSLLPR